MRLRHVLTKGMGAEGKGSIQWDPSHLECAESQERSSSEYWSLGPFAIDLVSFCPRSILRRPSPPLFFPSFPSSFFFSSSLESLFASTPLLPSFACYALYRILSSTFIHSHADVLILGSLKLPPTWLSLHTFFFESLIHNLLIPSTLFLSFSPSSFSSSFPLLFTSLPPLPASCHLPVL